MMTDQPKPASEQDYCLSDELVDKMNPKHTTTGEWTVGKVQKLLGTEVGDLNLQRVADAHNDALAAERESYIELCDKANGDMIELNQQLAAERKTVEEYEDYIKELDRIAEAGE